MERPQASPRKKLRLSSGVWRLEIDHPILEDQKIADQHLFNFDPKKNPLVSLKIQGNHFLPCTTWLNEQVDLEANKAALLGRSVLVVNGRESYCNVP